MSRRAGGEGHDEISSVSLLHLAHPLLKVAIWYMCVKLGDLSPMSNAQALDVGRVLKPSVKTLGW